jgi:endo-1,4-beta-mannosidase
LSGEKFLTGVNYWPRRKAMYWWSDFDAAEVADEFDIIASLGMDVVRVFLLWDDWQPDPDSVAAGCLDNFGTVCDLASERGLGLDVTFFTGHMSGPNWAPAWLLDASAPSYPSPHVRQVISSGAITALPYRNMFHDPTAIDAERTLLSTVVGEYAGHEAIWMWNLGNEPDLFAHPVDSDSGAAWVREMTSVIKGLDDIHPVTTGLHTASLFEDNGLRVDEVFAVSDVAVMHGYPMYVPWAKSELDPNFVPYLSALVSSLTGKPCLAEEWGGCTSPDTEGPTIWEWNAYGNDRTQYMAGEAEFATYVAETLPRLVAVGSTGAFLWCFADYATELWDRPPCDPAGSRHERHFGLVRPDGTLKPHAEAIKQFAATDPTVVEPIRRVELDITADAYYSNPHHHARRLYESF